MLLLVIASGLALSQADGCSKDTDCKGDRICESGRCVDPSEVPSARPQPVTAPERASAVMSESHRPESLHRHRGLFLRPDLGVGYASASASDSGTSVTLSGGAGAFGFAIGGSVADGVILAGHLWAVSAVNPTVTVNGQSGSSTNTTMSFVGIGPELDYYIMPVNMFLSVTVAASRGRLSVNGNDSDTEIGIAGQLAIGKEWWVSDRWGLGLKGDVTITSNKDSAATNPPTWTGYSFAVSFSATYN